MGRVESSVEIDVPIDKVFSYLSNPKNQEKMKKSENPNRLFGVKTVAEATSHFNLRA